MIALLETRTVSIGDIEGGFICKQEVKNTALKPPFVNTRIGREYNIKPPFVNEEKSRLSVSAYLIVLTPK